MRRTTNPETMKAPILALSTLLLASLAQAQSGAPSVVASWDPNISKPAPDGGIILTDTEGGEIGLRASTDAGVAIEQAADIPGGAALVFAGNQELPMATQRFFSLGPGQSVELDLYVGDIAESATILHCAPLEIRYNARDKVLTAIVYQQHESSGYVDTSVDCPPKTWHKVLVKLEEGQLSLDVDGVTKTVAVTAPMLQSQGFLLLGSRGRSYRPFAGKIGKVRILKE